MTEANVEAQKGGIVHVESQAKTHRTFHIQGEEKDLNAIAKATLGVSLDEIKKAIPK